MSVSRPAYYVF